MEEIVKKIENIDWQNITEAMRQNGFAIIHNLLSEQEYEALKEAYDQPGIYRKTVVMERYRFGLGEYKYFNYPLPDIIEIIRTNIYPKLASIANVWFKVLNIDEKFPLAHAELLQQCRSNNQDKATILILKYGKGGFNTLH